MKANQLTAFPVTGQQAPTLPLQAGTIAGYTGAQAIDISAIMNLMLVMVVMVMMMKMMGSATATI